jgi:hypothetical protein
MVGAPSGANRNFEFPPPLQGRDRERDKIVVHTSLITLSQPPPSRGRSYKEELGL